MKIYCKPCGKYLGEIRDATLHKKITFLCENCETKRIVSDMKNNKNNPPPLDSDIFKDIFGGKI